MTAAVASTAVAASAARTYLRREGGRRGRASARVGAVGGPGCWGTRPRASRSASLSSGRHDSYRSSGDFAIALASTWSAAGGRSGRWSVNAWRRVVHMGREHGPALAGRERRVAGQQLERRTGQRVLIARPSPAPALICSGRCNGRAQELALCDQAGRFSATLLSPKSDSPLIGPARAGVEQHVARLDIPVHQPGQCAASSAEATGEMMASDSRRQAAGRPAISATGHPRRARTASR